MAACSSFGANPAPPNQWDVLSRIFQRKLPSHLQEGQYMWVSCAVYRFELCAQLLVCFMQMGGCDGSSGLFADLSGVQAPRASAVGSRLPRAQLPIPSAHGIDRHELLAAATSALSPARDLWCRNGATAANSAAWYALLNQATERNS